MICEKCSCVIPSEYVEREEGRKRYTCPNCGRVVIRTSRREGLGRRPVIDVEEGGGLDISGDGDLSRELILDLRELGIRHDF